MDPVMTNAVQFDHNGDDPSTVFTAGDGSTTDLQPEVGADAQQQQIIFGDGIQQTVGIGEKLYAVVDGITYEIITGPNNELIARPADIDGSVAQTDDTSGEGGGMSLEDLANVSAEQATLQPISGEPDIGRQFITSEGYNGGGEGDTDTQAIKTEDQNASGSVAIDEQPQSQVIRIGDQEFVLGPGQNLPSELQEMVDQGMPIDFSNYEFVIDDGSGNQYAAAAPPTGIQYVDTQGNVVSGVEGMVNSCDVLTMLAEAASSSVTQQQVAGDIQYLGTSSFSRPKTEPVTDQWQMASNQQMVMTLPMFVEDENEDGEFSFVATVPDDTDQVYLNSTEQPPSGYLNSFIGFVHGARSETLASLANSTIKIKPPLPAYHPDPARPRTTASIPPAPPSTTNLRGGQAGGRGAQSAGRGGRGRGGRGGGTNFTTTKPKLPAMAACTPRQTVITPGQPTTSGAATRVLTAPGNHEGPGMVYTVVEVDGKMSVVATMGTDESSSSGLDVSSVSRVVNTPGKESRIIQRKRKGSDTDTDEEAELNEMMDGEASSTLAGSIGVVTGQISTAGAMSPGRGGRGRGRMPQSPRGGGTGRGRGVALSPVAVDSAVNSPEVSKVAMTGGTGSGGNDRLEPHNYQKGDFVVEWKDSYKTDGFPIWKIESGRLLQKFDPVLQDGEYIHKSASIYSSWSGDIRWSFKAILVDLVSTTGRRQEIVKVVDKYMPKPTSDSLEQDPLMELFNVYVQCLVSEAIEPNFLTNVRQQNEEYYEGPITQIDSLLEEAEKSALAVVSWKDSFKSLVDKFPLYRFNVLSSNDKPICAATPEGKMAAVETVSFYGCTYQRDFLTIIDESRSSIEHAETVPIGQLTLDSLPTYHALHHFKYLLYRNCQKEVRYLMQNKEKTGNVILEECLQNRIWVQEHLSVLKDLLQKCSIVVTVVTKSEEDTE